jgi:hypothetical protein
MVPVLQDFFHQAKGIVSAWSAGSKLRPVGMNAPVAPVYALQIAWAVSKGFFCKTHNAPQRVWIFDELAQVAGPARHGVVEVKALDADHAMNLFLDHRAAYVIDLAGEMTPEAQFYAGDETLDFVMRHVADNWNDHADGFGLELSHQENAGFPFIPIDFTLQHGAPGLMVAIRAIWPRWMLGFPAMTTNSERV